MHRGWRVVLALTVAAAAAPAPAQGATWEGRCTILGESSFERPIGAIPRPVRYTDAGTGRCTGALNGSAVTDTPILLAAEGMGSVGCLATQSTMFGTLTFTRATRTPHDDVVVHYAGEANGAMGQSVSRSRGRDAGYGISYVTALGRSDPSMAEACRTDTVHSVRWEATTQSITPSESTSGEPGPKGKRRRQPHRNRRGSGRIAPVRR